GVGPRQRHRQRRLEHRQQRDRRRRRHQRRRHEVSRRQPEQRHPGIGHRLPQRLERPPLGPLRLPSRPQLDPVERNPPCPTNDSSPFQRPPPTPASQRPN